MDVRGCLLQLEGRPRLLLHGVHFVSPELHLGKNCPLILCLNARLTEAGCHCCHQVLPQQQDGEAWVSSSFDQDVETVPDFSQSHQLPHPECAPRWSPDDRDPRSRSTPGPVCPAPYPAGEQRLSGVSRGDFSGSCPKITGGWRIGYVKMWKIVL